MYNVILKQPLKSYTKRYNTDRKTVQINQNGILKKCSRNPEEKGNSKREQKTQKVAD